VLGASGYTGEEVVRLLALHPSFSVTVLTGETQAGKVFAVCTSLVGLPLIETAKLAYISFSPRNQAVSYVDRSGSHGTQSPQFT
jgi:N-acetyl-gamma-glutamyl-phosphate reductase